MREFLKEEMGQYFEVVAEADGSSGLERARTYDADLIIRDVLMPGMTGFEVTRKLKKDFDTGHIPIILLTAMSSAEDHLKGVKSGADACIAKPFSPKLLLAKVFKLIEQREKLREKFSDDPNMVRPAIYASDKDKEFADRLHPDTNVRLCIVHQIRSLIKYVGSKHQKEFMKDLKLVYGAVGKDAAEPQSDGLETKWGEQYPIVIRSWRDNWEQLTEYFRYTPLIRKLIYTANTVEGCHRQIRKVTKNKRVFPDDTAPENLVYIAYRNIRKKWTMPSADWWSAISQQSGIKFGERFRLLYFLTLVGTRGSAPWRRPPPRPMSLK